MKSKRSRPRDNTVAADSSGQDKVVRKIPSDLDNEKKWLQLTRIDIEGFEFFYKKYRPKIYQYIFMRTLEKDLANDLTNETFSVAVDKLKSFAWQGYSFGAWLFKIARTVLAEELRRKKVRSEVPYISEWDTRDSGCRPDRDMEKLDDFRVLTMCLENLKSEPREVFFNHYGLGMTTTEISIVMGIKKATVQSHLQRGRQRLRKCLVENGIDRGLSRSASKVVLESVLREDGWGVLGAGDEESSEARGSKSGEGD